MTGHYFDAYQRLKKSEIIVSNLFIIPIHPIEPGAGVVYDWILSDAPRRGFILFRARWIGHSFIFVCMYVCICNRLKENELMVVEESAYMMTWGQIARSGKRKTITMKSHKGFCELSKEHNNMFFI